MTFDDVLDFIIEHNGKIITFGWYFSSIAFLASTFDSTVPEWHKFALGVQAISFMILYFVNLSV